MVDKIKITNNQSGFTITEVLVSIVVVSFLLVSVSTVIGAASNINQRTERRTEANSLAFSRVQDYINRQFSNIPIGDDASADPYLVEDFSAEISNSRLANPSGRVYVEPESRVDSVTVTSSTPFDNTVVSDASFVDGGEINVVDVDEVSGGGFDSWDFHWRVSDNSFSNFARTDDADPDNLGSPSLDLGSPRLVDTLRIEWYTCSYGSSNFRVEAKNGDPNTNSGWTTIVSGLSDNNPSCNRFDSNPQDVDVSSNTTPYEHWRFFFVDSDHPTRMFISEIQAFEDGSPGDVVEQRGSDASVDPGELYFSTLANDDLELNYDGSRGHQSIGILFDDVDIPQGVTLDDAYIEFTAQNSSPNNSFTVNVTGVDTDSAPAWDPTIPFVVDSSVDNDDTDADGLTGTTATTSWSPPQWSAGEAGPDTRVDVTDIVQEIVNRTGWTDGNDMAFAIQSASLGDNDFRDAERDPAPRLVLNWNVTTTTEEFLYEDTDGDGDADSPTLLQIRSVVEFDVPGGVRETVEYTTFVRQDGVSD